MKQARIAILASGNGSNAENIINYFTNHPLIKVAMVLSNNPDAFALQRAAKLGVLAVVFNKEQFRESDEVLVWLREKDITHIVLAGFLWLVPQNLLDVYPDRIINIHPALLPQYGGKGMYGSKVHEAVISNGDEETGVTIHLVNSRYDEGRILFQEYCKVEKNDTPDTIALKVQTLEYKCYPPVIEQWVIVSQASMA